MMFLFNDVLLDVGDPRDRLITSGCPLGYAALTAMTPPQVLSILRQTMFLYPQYPRERPGKASALAALVQTRMAANAVLCVRPPAATGPQDLRVRFAELSLPVLGNLANLRKEGALTPAAIDHVVWTAT
jgi:hypothetical protein